MNQFCPCLEYLWLFRCRNLPAVLNLPPSLETIHICCCSSIQALSCQLDGLQTLDIMGNSRLTSLESMSAEHPPSLETLSLFDCTTLASLPNEPQTYGSLKNLTIFGCPAIKILPRCLQQRLDSLDYKWLDARYE
uniref:Uncharacterized protein n=1 Tax=Triticum urartu TaxID=4572 RepID=A0A8R7NX50_TRIUA